MKACVVCDGESPDSATRCVRCGWPLSSKRSYWAYRVLTLVLIPAVLWLVSVFWERAERNRVDHEELERAQTQLLETLTEKMEGFVGLRMELWKATVSLVRPCPSTDERDGTSRVMQIAACGAHYSAVVNAVDQAVVDLTWRVDSLPIVSESTYRVLSALKSSYWQACADDKPAPECGYRQRALRLVHGIGLSADETSLKSCLHEREAAPHCKNSAAVMRTSVQGPIDTDANTFFCLVAADIKNARVSVFKRRSEAAGGDATLEELTDRLESNMKASACSAIVEEWNRQHPATRIGPTASK